jgi:hypothetical protein
MLRIDAETFAKGRIIRNASSVARLHKTTSKAFIVLAGCEPLISVWWWTKTTRALKRCNYRGKGTVIYTCYIYFIDRQMITYSGKDITRNINVICDVIR